MLNKNGNTTATLENLKREFTHATEKMRTEKAQIERLRQEIKSKETELERLEHEFEVTERQYHEYEREIREANDEIRKMQLDNLKEHSQTKRF